MCPSCRHVGKADRGAGRVDGVGDGVGAVRGRGLQEDDVARVVDPVGDPCDVGPAAVVGRRPDAHAVAGRHARVGRHRRALGSRCRWCCCTPAAPGRASGSALGPGRRPRWPAAAAHDGKCSSSVHVSSPDCETLLDPPHERQRTNPGGELGANSHRAVPVAKYGRSRPRPFAIHLNLRDARPRNVSRTRPARARPDSTRGAAGRVNCPGCACRPRKDSRGQNLHSDL